MSQQALADRLNTSQQSIYKYENQITEPGIDMLRACKAQEAEIPSALDCVSEACLY